MGTFQERITELEASVGYGTLTGKVLVDQPYAQDQHETLNYAHKGGGKARYLGDPLFANFTRHMQRLASMTLEGNLTYAMIRNMEDLSAEVYENAPFEFGDLKGSASPKVIDNEAIVYDRPANVGRLDEGDLAAKQALRNLGFGHNSWENTEND